MRKKIGPLDVHKVLGRIAIPASCSLTKRHAPVSTTLFGSIGIIHTAGGAAGGACAAEQERAEAMGAVQGASDRRDLHDGGRPLRQAQSGRTEVGAFGPLLGLRLLYAV